MGIIKFCNLCGGILKLEEKEYRKIWVCLCGFVKEDEIDLIISEKVEMKEELGDGVASEINSSGFPHTCKKCGHEECEVRDLGAKVSDESNIILYKCNKCSYTDRQADGSSNM